VKRQHSWRIDVIGQGVLVRNQCHGLQEGLQALLFVLEYHSSQFQNVFPPVQTFFALVLDVRLIADILQNAVKQDGDPVLLRALAPALQHPPKAYQAGRLSAKRFLPGWIAFCQPQ